MPADNLISKSAGNRIRQARKSQRLTQKELADKLGISNVTLNRYEKGHRSPDMDVLGKLVTILKCDSGWIVGGENVNADDSGLKDVAICSKPVASHKHYSQDLVLDKIMQLLNNDLPEDKEHILKILIGRKKIKEGFHSLGLTGN